jgi:uncharacterized membrane protein YecN with MAPEG domain
MARAECLWTDTRPAAAGSRASARIAKHRAYSDFLPRCKPMPGLARCLRRTRMKVAAGEDHMPLTVTLTLAAACAALNLWLGLRLVGRRLGGISVGHGDDEGMLRDMRAHANFVEYAPFVLALVVAIELAGGSRMWLWVASAAFVLARVAHPFGMRSPRPHPLRAGGALVTWLVLAGLGIWAGAPARSAAPHA